MMPAKMSPACFWFSSPRLFFPFLIPPGREHSGLGEEQSERVWWVSLATLIGLFNVHPRIIINKRKQKITFSQIVTRVGGG